jgi:hypothetical protein
MGKHNSRLEPMPAANGWRKTYRGRIHYVDISYCSSKAGRGRLGKVQPNPDDAWDAVVCGAWLGCV